MLGRCDIYVKYMYMYNVHDVHCIDLGCLWLIDGELS